MVQERVTIRLALPLLASDFLAYPEPVFRGEHLWAVTADELGVQRMNRFRLGTAE
jgi:hypothetical protein